jgi:hypothetical protein
MYERPLNGRARVLYFIVPKRDAATVLNIIYKHIAPGTVIHSDSWPAYSRILRLDRNYQHSRVNHHQLHFVSPDNPTLHTNGIAIDYCIQLRLQLRLQF